MATMIGVRPLGSRQVSVDEFPIPDPPPGDVRIKIQGAGVCGSDLHVYRRRPEEIPDRLQIILGHEPAGIVDALGEGVTSLETGDRVTVYHHAGCGHCEACQVYRPQYCPEARVPGRTQHGSDAECMLAPALHCHRVPDNVSLEDASLVACIGGTGWSALRQQNVAATDTVAVYGLGPLGLATALLAKALGARVIGTEISAGRRELAGQTGVDVVLDPADGGADALLEASGGGVPKAVETSGSESARADSVQAAAPLGSIVYLGVGDPLMGVDPDVLVNRQLRLIGSWVQEPHEMVELLRFMSRREISFAPIITHRFPLREAQAAFATADAGQSGRGMFGFD